MLGTGISRYLLVYFLSSRNKPLSLKNHETIRISRNNGCDENGVPVGNRMFRVYDLLEKKPIDVDLIFIQKNIYEFVGCKYSCYLGANQVWFDKYDLLCITPFEYELDSLLSFNKVYTERYPYPAYAPQCYKAFDDYFDYERGIFELPFKDSIRRKTIIRHILDNIKSNKDDCYKIEGDKIHIAFSLVDISCEVIDKCVVHWVVYKISDIAKLTKLVIMG